MSCNKLSLLNDSEFDMFFMSQQNDRIYPEFDPISSGEVRRDLVTLYKSLYEKTPSELFYQLKHGVCMDMLPRFMEKFYLNSTAAFDFIHRNQLQRKPSGSLEYRMMKNAFRIRADEKVVSKLHQNRFGELQEQNALNAFRNTLPYGYSLRKIEVAVHPQFPILSCVPDAICVNVDSEECFCVEVKMRYQRNWIIQDPKFKFQAQMQMALTKLGKHVLILFDPSTCKILVDESTYDHAYVLREMRRIRSFFFSRYFPHIAEILLYAQHVVPKHLYNKQKDYEYFVKAQAEWKKHYTYMIEFPVL